MENLGGASGEVPDAPRKDAEKGPKAGEARRRRVLGFGPFRLDVAGLALERDGRPVRLTPRVFDLLVYLVENAGRIVTKEELLENVWHGTFVEEGNINRNVSTLRRALGEEAGDNSLLETVPRRGYRFVLPVREIADEEGGEAPAAADGGGAGADRSPQPPQERLPDDGPGPVAAPAPLAARPEGPDLSPPSGLPDAPAPAAPVRSSRLRRAAVLAVLVAVGLGSADLAVRRNARVDVRAPTPSLAILPFRLLDGARDGEAIGLGVADAIVTRLGASGSVVVRPTSAVARYSGGPVDPVLAGRELEVAYVLDGRAQRNGPRIRFTVQLLATADGRTVWAQTYDEPQGDFLALQDTLSREVVLGIRTALALPLAAETSRRYTRDPEAYSLYAKGRRLWNRRSSELAPPPERDPRVPFRMAIERDPDFAMAYVGLAQVLAFDGPRSRGWKEAEELSHRALAIDDSLGEAWATLGFVETYHEHEWAEAQRSFRKALALSPNDATAHQWYGAWLALQGRLEEARLALGQALQIDPASSPIAGDLAELSYFAGDLEGSAAAYRALLARDPDFETARIGLAKVLVAEGRIDEALGVERGLPAPAPSAARAPAAARFGLPVPFATLIRLPSVAELFRAGPDGRYAPDHSWFRAVALAQAGDRDGALLWLERARDDRDFFVVYAKVEPAFRFLRDEPRWRGVVRSIGLEP